MPINLNSETPISLTDATRVLPPIDGKRPHPSTIFRWCKRGLRGIRLEYCRVGHRICTSQEALSRFVNRLAETDDCCATVSARTCPENRTARKCDQSIRRNVAVVEVG
jgi:Protein of unknown function (DUF1580)